MKKLCVITLILASLYQATVFAQDVNVCMQDL